jgi:hypothetical protein
MRHALIVSPIASHPSTQGNAVRIQSLGRRLQQHGFFVHMLHYALEGVGVADQAAMSACWDFVYTVPPVPISPEMSLGTHFGLDDWWAPGVGRLACRLDQAWSFDLCLVNYVWFSAVLDYLPSRVRKIIDTHDVFADRHQRSAAFGVDASWFFTTEAEEARGLARADTAVAIQQQEAQFFASVGAKNVETIGSIGSARFLPGRSRGDRLRVGYIGSANPWNVHAIERLHAVLLARPDVAAELDLVIAGPICQAVSRFNCLFTPLGIVDDASEFYAAVDLVINPMVGGTGLKIKSIEALGFGLPLLATADAMVGIGSLHPDHNLPSLERLVDRLGELSDPTLDLTPYRLASRQTFTTYTAAQIAAFDRVFLGSGR